MLFSESCLSVATSWFRRVLSLPCVSDIRDISALSIDRVGHLLQPSIRQVDKVLPLGRISIPALSLAKVIVSVVILHSILVSILRRLIGVGGGGAAVPRLVRAGEDGSNEAQNQ